MVFTPTDNRTGGRESANAAFARSGSILAVDFGSVYTRAVLIDLVDGIYQQVATGEARTTAGFPHNDVGIGLAHAAAEITRATRRRLLTDDNMGIISPETPDRKGVDIIRFTASIGRPLRTVMMGLVPQMSIASAARATAGTYVQVVETISLDDERTPQQQLNAILLSRPDLIFIVGGTEGGARQTVLELVTLTRLALRFGKRSSNPPILYAGNTDLIDEIKSAFADVTSVFIAENVRPILESETLESAAQELALAYDAVSSQRGLGFDRVGAMSDIGVLPTAQSYDVIAEYLGRSLLSQNRRAGGVLIADLGSSVSTLSAAVYGTVSTSIRTDIGVGASAVETLERVGIEAVRMWLPFLASDDDIRAYAYNKRLRPAIVPENHRALYYEHALARAALRKLVSDTRPAWTRETALDNPNAPLPQFQQIIGAGSTLTRTGQPALSAMLMLDAFQPSGVTALYLDESALIPALGTLAPTNPEAVVQVLDAAGLNLLAACFSVDGAPRPGRAAVKVTLTIRKDDGTRQTEQHTINGGEFWAYPLDAGVSATISVRTLRRGATLGGRRSIRMEINGGRAGVIVDARGRPIPVPLAMRARAAAITAWYAQATGQPIHEIPEDWLTEAKADAAPVVKQKPPKIGTGELPELGDLFQPEAEAAPAGRRGRRKKDKAAAPTPAETQAQQTAQEEDDDLRNLFS
ncbi:MAG: glutamate mutase L [bacterium]|nr:glutamate mutase L [bacterium]